MTFRHSPCVAIALLASSFLFSFVHGTAQAGRIYKGFSRNHVVEPAGAAPLEMGKIDFKIRLPRKKGDVRSLLRTLTTDPPFPANVPIAGKVRKHQVRRGGDEHTYIGNWNWKLSRAGFAGNAKGRFKIIVRKLSSRYKLRHPVKVRLEGEGPPEFRFTSRVSAGNIP